MLPSFEMGMCNKVGHNTAKSQHLNPHGSSSIWSQCKNQFTTITLPFQKWISEMHYRLSRRHPSVRGTNREFERIGKEDE